MVILKQLSEQLSYLSSHRPTTHYDGTRVSNCHILNRPIYSISQTASLVLARWNTN